MRHGPDHLLAFLKPGVKIVDNTAMHNVDGSVILELKILDLKSFFVRVDLHSLIANEPKLAVGHSLKIFYLIPLIGVQCAQTMDFLLKLIESVDGGHDEGSTGK